VVVVELLDLPCCSQGDLTGADPAVGKGCKPNRTFLSRVAPRGCRKSQVAAHLT